MLELNKRKGLPQWLRDALNKKEKEKQKKIEKEKAKKSSGDESDEGKKIPKEKIQPKKSLVKKV